MLHGLSRSLWSNAHSSIWRARTQCAKGADEATHVLIQVCVFLCSSCQGCLTNDHKTSYCGITTIVVTDSVVTNSDRTEWRQVISAHNAWGFSCKTQRLEDGILWRLIHLQVLWMMLAKIQGLWMMLRLSAETTAHCFSMWPGLPYRKQCIFQQLRKQFSWRVRGGK